MINTVDQDQLATVILFYSVNHIRWSYVINTADPDQVAVWAGSAVLITKSSYSDYYCRTRSSSSVIRFCSVYNKVILYALSL